MRPHAERLAEVYRAQASELRATYAGVLASTYLDEVSGFGEFMCWFDHVAYAHAIDALIAAGVMQMPAARYVAALWQEAPGAGSF